MINVNIEKFSLEKLFLNGFTLEHGNNVLNVRNIYGKIVVEIIYIEDTNKILIHNNKESYLCDKIVDIKPSQDKVYLRINYEYKGKNYFRTVVAG